MPEEMSAFFDARAAGYDAHMASQDPEQAEYYRVLASAIRPTSDTVALLDLGCGTGEELHEVFRLAPNAQVTGIDMSSEMAALLRRKHSGRQGQIRLVQGSYLEVDLGHDQFDYAISAVTMHHLLHDAKREVYRRVLASLKAGGKYIEADYIVPADEEALHLERYCEAMAHADADPQGLYHIDIPFSVETQTWLLLEAGFGSVESLFDNRRNKAILCATKGCSYWVGGSPCAGKSTVTDILARAFGLTAYHCDEHYEGRKARADEHLHPAFYRMSRMSWEELFMPAVDEQIADELAFHGDEFPLVLEDLRGLEASASGVIVEGTPLLPSRVHGLGVPRDRALWVVPTREFQLANYSKREWIHGILTECSDPPKAFSNWMERDMGFAEHVAAEARALGYRVVVIDGTVGPQDVAAAVAAHFGLGESSETA